MTATHSQHPCVDPTYMFTFDPKILRGTSASPRIVTTDNAAEEPTVTSESGKGKGGEQ